MARTFACGLACLLVLCFWSCAVCAAEYEVSQDGTGDFTTIQKAIGVAKDGDAIIVHPGTYYENIHFNGKNITIQSVDPNKEKIVASTVIDGGQSGSVVTFAGTEDERCLLSGLTIRNGKAQSGGGIFGTGCHAEITKCMIAGNWAEYRGAGLGDCDGTISNCTISCNSTGRDGGGLSWCDGRITNCTITGNSAGFGGGLFGCDSTISNCTISANSAWAGGGGLSNCQGTISNCTISANSASAGGGLGSCCGTITNCTISANSAHFGGGLNGYNRPISNCTISNCTITGNSALDGGGLYAYDGTITNCTITGNSAGGRGGGLFGCDGPISNCTISDNSALSEGGGLGSCGATISNCIVWGNDAGEGSQLDGCKDAVIRYCCVQGWTGGGEGNISDDPLFVSGPLGDYYLSCAAAGQDADSPCIDAGSDTAEALALNQLTTRTDQIPDSGVVDMGYHYPLPLQPNPHIVCSLDAGEFAPGDTLVGFIEAHNPGPDIAVDAYVAFVLPDGVIVSLTAGGLASGISPWIPDVLLPSGLDFGPSDVLRINVPQTPGSYIFAAALTYPGELAFIGQPSLFPFTIKGGS